MTSGGAATDGTAEPVLNGKNANGIAVYSYFRCYQHPTATGFSFFYAAIIRVNRKKIHAWDSAVALEMLLSGYKSIISNVNLIENSGQDDIASHYSNPDLSLNQIVSSTEDVLASETLDTSKFWSKKTDSEIENKIYNLKNRHLLSPIKAIIGL